MLTSLFYWFLNGIFISSLLWIWSKKVQKQPLKKYFWAGLSFKLLAGILMGLLYLYIYPNSDSWHFFRVSKRLCEVAFYDFEDYLHILSQTNPHKIAKRCHHYLYIFKDSNWRAFFVYKIVHVFHFLTGSNYWLINLYFSLFAYCGLWEAANALSQKYGNTKAFAFSFLFLPSSIFWASGLSKESLFWGFFGLLIAFLLKKRTFWNLLFILLMAYGLWFVKYYYLIIFVASYLSFSFVDFAAKKYAFSEAKKIVFFFSIVLFPIFLMTQFYDIIRPEKVLKTIVKNHDQIAKNSSLENIIVFELEATPKSFLRESPKALLGALFRPFIWEKGNLLKKIASLENTMLLFLLFFIPSAFYTKISYFETSVLLFYIVVLGVFLAFSSPNFGTLLRYKVGIMPFWSFLCSYFFFQKDRKITIFGFVIPIL